MTKRFFGCVLFSLMVPFIFSIGYAKPFYEGKVIKIIVTTKPGGGYDFYGRLVSQAMQKYLPGSIIIVKNIPGAGHVVGLNALYNSKPDGLTFGTFSAALPLSQLVGLKGIKFDLTKMCWLGSAGTNPQTYIVSTKTPFKKLDDLKKADKIVQSAGGVGSLNYVFTLLLMQMTGLDNIKISTGYQGGEDNMALIRGETQAMFHGWDTVYPLVKDGYALPLLIVAEKSPPGYPMPLLQDIVKDKKYTATINLMRAVCNLGRPFAGPPGIPKDRFEIIKDAFSRALNDAEYIKIAERAGRPIEFVNAEDTMNSIKGAMEVSPEIVTIIKRAYGTN